MLPRDLLGHIRSPLDVHCPLIRIGCHSSTKSHQRDDGQSEDPPRAHDSSASRLQLLLPLAAPVSHSSLLSALSTLKTATSLPANRGGNEDNKNNGNKQRHQHSHDQHGPLISIIYLYLSNYLSIYLSIFIRTRWTGPSHPKIIGRQGPDKREKKQRKREGKGNEKKKKRTKCKSTNDSRTWVDRARLTEPPTAYVTR